MPTVGSLFSGIGGLDLGLERAGFQVLWQVEINEFCRRVLDKHWPHVTKYSDITTLDPTTLAPVDLLCGGFPCQPISVAGRRKAQADSRWLWPEFSRVIGVLKPRWVLVENVPGLRSANGGAAFAEVLQDLARHGYDAEWASIPAAAVGASHLRYRLFLVAYSNVERLQGRLVLSERPRQFPAGSSRVVRDATSERLPDWAGGTLGEPSPLTEFERPSGWEIERDFRGVPHGVSRRVDRLRALGNAVVPQVAQWVGERIMKGEADVTTTD